MASAKSKASAVLPALLLAVLTVILYFVTYQVFCAALVAITAWNSVVKTMELNDFRQRIKTSQLKGSRYIAALVATRLGLRDALIDWAIIYSIGYAVVAGFTWKGADPNSLLVLWGFSVIIAALILGVLSLKVPHWLGLYPKSGLRFISDTSNLAKPAFQKLIGNTSGEGEEREAGSILDFRYQVRLAIGSHFAKFGALLLPFYVSLKVWWFVASVFIGSAFGYTYMYVIYQSRMRFQKHRKGVALLASAYMSVASALLFLRGVDIADESWNLNFAKNSKILMFVGWLLICLLLQIASYYHYYTFKGNAPRKSTIERFSQDIVNDRPSLFDNNVRSAQGKERTDEPHLETVVEHDEEYEKSLEEPFLDRRERYKKNSIDDDGMAYFYHTGYFDPNNLRTKDELAEREAKDSDVVPSSCMQNYESVIAGETSDERSLLWYSRIWIVLPLKPLFDIYLLGFHRTISCCGGNKESDFKKSSCCEKFFFVLSRTIGIVLNLYAIYVAIVACGATLQINNTKAKLPYVNEKLYKHMNDGYVCAFSHKLGDIKTFPSRAEAHLANYSIAHCGPCGHCSNWNDLELQWSTRSTLAIQSQKCAIRSLSGGFDGLQECLQGPMIGGTHGFTNDCARCWAEDIVCTKKFCIFIYLQTKMTNQVGNFKVGPNSITSATCEEANCEARNPGNFVGCVGANRRRMNITSGIARPGAQQCEIVDVESWDDFFPP